MTFDESLRGPDGDRTRYVLIDSEVSLPSDLKTKTEAARELASHVAQ